MAQTILNPFKWWSMNVSAGYECQNMELSDYTNESHAFALDISTMFTIRGGFNVNGSLRYRSDAINGLNIQENSPVQANVTVNKNFLKNSVVFSSVGKLFSLSKLDFQTIHISG